MAAKDPGYTHEVAISATVYDSRIASRLAERLRSRLRPAAGVNAVWSRADAVVEKGAAARAPDASAASDILRTSRIIVVVHQRLWDTAPATRDDAETIKLRLGKAKPEFLHVVRLDDAPLPSWLAAAKSSTLAEGDAHQCVESILEAVTKRGGRIHAAGDDDHALRAAADEQAEHDRAAFLGSHRALSLLDREFDRLMAEVEKRADALAESEAAPSVDVKRAPGRCMVQLGPVALSLSWVRSRATSVAEGRLLVIEWAGAIGRDAGTEGRSQPVPLREDVLRVDATRPEDWTWRSENSAMREYDTRELAALCVDSLAHALHERTA